jgi:aspartyl-tRNA(Asn)/glutamyl-tRNA(Gln) amidotransferase subunit A
MRRGSRRGCTSCPRSSSETQLADFHHSTLTQLAAGLRARKFSSVELTEAFLARIERHQQGLNAFISVTGEQALAAARAADRTLASGAGGALTGVPIAHKDLFCTAGVRTTCGSRMLDNFVAPYDATVVAKLKGAGAVMLGKTNMDEFAMGSSNETSYYGPVRNPWNPQLVPGGSSGGSAAAVAARLVPGATATDTGGSIRQPAALCGVTGMKPTYGRVSRYGMVAFASSLDQGGVLTATAADAALMLREMAGFDAQDSTSVDTPVPDYVAGLEQPLAGLKIGLLREFFDKGLDAENEQRVREALKVYEGLGARLSEVSLPHLPLSVPVYYVVAPAECSSNLARFDGVRFGHRCENPRDLNDLYRRSRGEGFGAEVKRRVMTGTYVLSAGYYDAYYLKAQRVRALITEDFRRAFADVDVLIGPTTPTPAFALGAKTADPITMYLNDIYTIGANLAGLPAISVPCGFVGALPVGLQIVGPHFSEGRVLQVAHAFQKLTDWHTRAPAGYA